MSTQAKTSHRPKVHPCVRQYADLLGIEFRQFVRFLRREEKIAGLWPRLRAVRRMETRPIPIRQLVVAPTKKHEKSPAKPSGNAS